MLEDAYKIPVSSQMTDEAEHERRMAEAAQRAKGFLAHVQQRIYEPIPTGLIDIDKALAGGMMRGQLVILGAAPGMGKTALATWIFSRLALNRVPSLYLNLEMSFVQLEARRYSTTLADTECPLSPTEVLQAYDRKPDEWEQIVKASDRVTAIDAYMQTPAQPLGNLDEIVKYINAEAARMEALNQRAPFVILDYLQKVQGNPGEDRTAAVQRAIAAMKDYALKHRTIAFVIVAHNREANKNGRISMEAARDTSDIEYTADLQLGMTYTGCLYPIMKEGKDGKKYEYYRTPSDLKPDEKKFLTVQVTKARFGQQDATSHLYFDGESMTFRQVGYDWIPLSESEGKTFEEFTGIKVDTGTGRTSGVEIKNRSSGAVKKKKPSDYDA